MSAAVHANDVTNDNLAAMRVQLADDLVRLASNSSGGQDVVYRPLRATDFNNGVVTAGTVSPLLAANVYNLDVYSTWLRVGPNQAVGIYGIAFRSAAPLIDEITFRAGPTTLAIVPTGHLLSSKTESRGFFFPPITWAPNEHVTIDLISRLGGAAGADVFDWLGLVAEIENTVAKPRALIDGRTPGAV